MEPSAGMVAGSYWRNELIRNRYDSNGGVKPLTNLNGQICQICGDDVRLIETGNVFIACNECGFPLCRSCYEYEKKDGTQCCPQCKTRLRRHNESPQNEGDENVENEFDYTQGNNKERLSHRAEGFSPSSQLESPISLLAHGHPVSGEIHATDRNVVLSPCIDPQLAVPVRIVDPSKDLNSYGLGHVDWKDRIEGWKLKQDKNMIQVIDKYYEGRGGDIERTGSNGEELQMDDDARLPMNRVVPIPSSRMTPYRIVIVLRLIILGVFLHYRTTHPVKDAYALWLTSVIYMIEMVNHHS